jgi:polysaccharide biosynthesis protein PslG
MVVVLLSALAAAATTTTAATRHHHAHSRRHHVRAHHHRRGAHRSCTSPLAVASPAAVSAEAAVAPRLRVRNPFGSHLFGIASGGGLQAEPGRERRRDIADDRRAGARWVRVDINWAQIQPAGPHRFDWRVIDRVVRRARRCGMHVLGTIMYSPPWTRPPGTSPIYSPGSAAYATFAGEAARHLSRLGVHDYEIWNEPNSGSFIEPVPDVGAYAAMLIAADEAIKAVAPHATVITGGMAPASNSDDSIAPLTFLRQLYRDGAGGHFDAVGAHPYTWPAMPGARRPWSAWYQMYRRHNSLRSIMKAHGDGAKRIWATEFGAPTGGPRGSGFVSDTTQAKIVARAYHLWAHYKWAGPLFLYQGRDAGVAKTTIGNFFGFINFNFTRKPAFSAYQRVALLISDALRDSKRR